MTSLRARPAAIRLHGRAISPVGCPDFKSGGGRSCVSGEFDSHLFRQNGVQGEPVATGFPLALLWHGYYFGQRGPQKSVDSRSNRCI